MDLAGSWAESKYPLPSPPLPPTMVDLEGKGGFFKRYYYSSHYLPGVLMDQVSTKKMWTCKTLFQDKKGGVTKYEE